MLGLDLVVLVYLVFLVGLCCLCLYLVVVVVLVNSVVLNISLFACWFVVFGAT